MSTDIRPRQPKGIPIGGQYAAFAHQEPGIRLDVARDRVTMAERRELFNAPGFVPAATLQAATAPTTTEHRDEWWNRNFVAAEYRANGKTYPQMPDSYTPSRTLGNGLDGHRRTHRMNYGNKDIQLRMPSATSIRRYSEENGNPTFDVPVSVSLKGGAPVQGWVRVTKTGPHSWETTTLGGNGGDASEQVAEAVAAVLESRRVTLALAKVPDLLKARKEREAAKGAAMTPVASSFIDSVGFDPATNTMATKIGNRIYGHKVSQQFFEAVKASERPGAVFNKLVRAHQAAGVVQCGTCLRFTSTAIAHKCPSGGHKPEQGIGLDHVEAARKRAEAVAANRSRGIDPALAKKVLPAPAPVRTAPSKFAQPVPAKKTGLPGPRRQPVPETGPAALARHLEESEEF